MRHYQFKRRNRRPRRKAGRLDWAGWICGLLSVMGLLLCLVWVAGASGDLIRDAQSDARLAKLKQIQTASDQYTAAPDPTPTPSAPSEPTAKPIPTTTPTPTVLPSLAPLATQNPDLAGWLAIEGTVIDYPVMFTPGSPPPNRPT